MQLLDPLINILFQILVWWSQWGIWAIPILEVIAIWFIIMVATSIITRLFRRRATRLGVPADAVNGIVLALRLFAVYGAFITLFIIVPPLGVLATTVIGSSSLLLGTAVGLAVGQAVRNIVAGIYVMFTNPFNVRDYVRIGDSEGIVLEISMNYTKIRQADGSIALIPNNSVLSSTVENFRFKQKHRDSKRGKSSDEGSIPRRLLRTISSSVIDPLSLIQYSFRMAFPRTDDIVSYDKAFDLVCERWADRFGFPPVYALADVTHVAFSYAFTIFVDDAQKLLEFKSDFMEDIVGTVYRPS
jgi:hypothetical protein